MINNLTGDEVLIIDSHDDIFKDYQIYFWRKDKISDILPAIKCPSFKSEIKIFKTIETLEIGNFIYNQKHTKSFVIENANDKLYINLVYGETIKITSNTFDCYLQSKFFDKLKERYELWEIEDCACKPKKIRVWVSNFKSFQHAIKKLEGIANINDAKLGIDVYDKDYYLYSSSRYNTIVFNHSSRQMSDNDTNFVFSGDTLAAVCDGKYYNFRLDESTKESEDSVIKGKNIIKNKSKNYFALDLDRTFNLWLIHTDEEEINSKDKKFIEDLKEISTQKMNSLWYLIRKM